MYRRALSHRALHKRRNNTSIIELANLWANPVGQRSMSGNVFEYHVKNKKLPGTMFHFKDIYSPASDGDRKTKRNDSCQILTKQILGESNFVYSSLQLPLLIINESCSLLYNGYLEIRSSLCSFQSHPKITIDSAEPNLNAYYDSREKKTRIRACIKRYFYDLNKIRNKLLEPVRIVFLTFVRKKHWE